MIARLPIRLLFCMAAAAAARADIIDRIAVSVGNRVITATDLDREIRVVAFLAGKAPSFTPQAKREVADRMVEQTLVRRELEASRYPTPSPAEVEPELQKLKAERPNTAVPFADALKAAGTTEQDIRDEMLWLKTLLAFLDVRFRPAVQVTDAQIQDYFDKVQKPMVLAAHPGQPVSLDDYRDQIEETLINRSEDQEMDRWLAEAKKRTPIVYHDEVFK